MNDDFIPQRHPDPEVLRRKENWKSSVPFLNTQKLFEICQNF